MKNVLFRKPPLWFFVVVLLATTLSAYVTNIVGKNYIEDTVV